MKDQIDQQLRKSNVDKPNRLLRIENMLLSCVCWVDKDLMFWAYAWPYIQNRGLLSKREGPAPGSLQYREKEPKLNALKTKKYS